MKSLFKCRKALSPVVAAIILIAVTVAVSIAVAAWMGALTFTFMKTEELKVTSHTWVWDAATPNNRIIKLNTKNTGTSKITLSELRINDNSLSSPRTQSGTISVDQWNSTASGAIKNTLDPGDEVTIYIRYAFSAGTKYDFTVYAATGTKGLYTATAP